MAKSKDLFDDTTMTFGEHLEALRMHLWKALIGVFICVIGALFIGDDLVVVIRRPVDQALADYGIESEDAVSGFQVEMAWQRIKAWWHGQPPPEPETVEEEALDPQVVRVRVSARELLDALHQADPERFPQVEAATDASITLHLAADEFREFRRAAQRRPITLNFQEAFLTYLKVALIAGLVIASPWVFYQIWAFVAAGLYPHERRYVYIYLPISLTLFIGGALFCFFVVFPFILSFLLGFNRWLGVEPFIRLSEWISFAILLPVMFGLSFQLPLIMLFLERISVFEAKDYREKRRLAILVISIASMLLTPSDPGSMIAMMLPLIVLYEFGILLCRYSPGRHVYGPEPI